MCHESPSKALKSHPLDVLSFVMKHGCKDEDKKERILSMLTQKWLNKTSQHIGVILAATKQKNSPVLIALKHMWEEARIAAATITGATAPAHNVNATERNGMIVHDHSTKVKEIAEPIEPIEPYPVEVARYRTARNYQCTLLLKQENKPESNSDDPNSMRKESRSLLLPKCRDPPILSRPQQWRNSSKTTG